MPTVETFAAPVTKTVPKGVARFEGLAPLATRVVPTRRLVAILALMIPASAFLTAAGLGTVALLADLALLGLAWLSTRFTPDLRALRFERRMDAVLSNRVANRVLLTLTNEGDERIVGRMRDEPPRSFGGTAREFALDLAPGERRTFEYSVNPPERGGADFPGTFLRLAAPIGLAWRQAHLPTEQTVEVYPNVLALREFDLLNQQGRLREIGIRKSRMRGQGTEFESLREYTDGDDVRRIDWNATARRGKPIVRQYEVERNQAVLLCVDCGRHMLAEVGGVRKLDHVLDAILMLAHTAANAGDNVGVLAYGDGPIVYVPPKKGREAIGVMLHALHDLEAEPIESDAVKTFAYLSARVKRRALVLNFTAMPDLGRAKEVATGLSPMLRRHLVLTVDVSDPKLKESLGRTMDSPEAMAAVAAAQWIERDRREALAYAAASGLRTLEAEPQDLAAALVNAYLDVKSRGAL